MEQLTQQYMEQSMEQLTRDQLRKRYAGLYEEVLDILFTNDPMRINFGDNKDEYEPEVDTILPRLGAAQSIDDVRKMIHKEFVRWFSENLAGPEDRYAQVAEEVWEAWLRWPKRGLI